MLTWFWRIDIIYINGLYYSFYIIVTGMSQKRGICHNLEVFGIRKMQKAVDMDKHGSYNKYRCNKFVTNDTVE